MPELLHLYRNILKKAGKFPSRNRSRVINEIKGEFRKNRHMPTGPELAKAIGVAKKGLVQLSMYTDLPPAASSWAVHLDKEPMPKRE